ncbi:HIT zinc finger [Phlyctema vagabunda]|uniref:HIT zinc finger n=1 Tax=Phlyctema vagabunda TaxID=108571 RepID=A0ABR4P6P9_9HELO
MASRILLPVVRAMPKSPSATFGAIRSFQSSSSKLAELATPLPVRKPVGAFRGGLFGFLLGSTLSGAGVYYYVLEEYKISNELLTEDIYSLQASVQRVHTYVQTLEEKLGELEKKKPVFISAGIELGPTASSRPAVKFNSTQPSAKSHPSPSTLNAADPKMLGFGVREEVTAKVAPAPGWAYVPDTGVNASVTASQPSSRKRARNTQPNASAHETTAKQDAKTLRELAALERENHRDVSIPVPIRHRDNAGRVSHGKVTPGVRKILQSQKTFANHLSDFEALSVLASNLPQPVSVAIASPATRAGSGAGSAHPTSTGKRSHKKKDPNAPPVSTPLRRVSTPSQVTTPASFKTESSHDMMVIDTPVLSSENIVPPTSHPGDHDLLLASKIPPIPTSAELEELLAAPALNYNEARGEWTENDRRKPVRQFCEVCGYWGRIKCTRCGGRVCALDCLGLHQEDCFTRYGA